MVYEIKITGDFMRSYDFVTDLEKDIRYFRVDSFQFTKAKANTSAGAKPSEDVQAILQVSVFAYKFSASGREGEHAGVKTATASTPPPY